MSTPLPTTEIIAFRELEVKHGQITLPFLARGEWHGLTASEKLWKQLLGSFRAVFQGESAPLQELPERLRKRHNGKADPIFWAKMHALYAEFESTPSVFARDFARAHGVPLHSLYRAFGQIRNGTAPFFPAAPAAPAERQPILKPNGSLS